MAADDFCDDSTNAVMKVFAAVDGLLLEVYEHTEKSVVLMATEQSEGLWEIVPERSGMGWKGEREVGQGTTRERSENSAPEEMRSTMARIDSEVSSGGSIGTECARGIRKVPRFVTKLMQFVERMLWYSERYSSKVSIIYSFIVHVFKQTTRKNRIEL